MHTLGHEPVNREFYSNPLNFSLEIITYRRNKIAMGKFSGGRCGTTRWKLNSERYDFTQMPCGVSGFDRAPYPMPQVSPCWRVSEIMRHVILAVYVSPRRHMSA